jgi:hypothetical protein
MEEIIYSTIQAKYCGQCGYSYDRTAEEWIEVSNNCTCGSCPGLTDGDPCGINYEPCA